MLGKWRLSREGSEVGEEELNAGRIYGEVHVRNTTSKTKSKQDPGKSQ